MSESEEHRILVRQMAEMIQGKGGDMRVCADISDYPNVPRIGIFYPDVYARHLPTGRVYICEAKTLGDLETSRSSTQISVFVNHLERQSQGSAFMLGGYGKAAQRAKTLLRFTNKEKKYSHCSLWVFDGLDCWSLDKAGGRLWLLH